YPCHVRGERSPLELRGEGEAPRGVLYSQLSGALPSFEATMRCDHMFEQRRAGLHADSPGIDVVGDRGTLRLVRELPSARLLWHELTETTDLLLNRPKTWCWIGFCRPDTRRSPSDVDSSN